MIGWRSKEVVGFLLGITIACFIMLLPISGLEHQGKICLALSMTAVLWWAFKVMNPGFVSLALLAGYCLCLDSEIVSGSVIFGAFTSPVMYMVIGGFLIAEAVQASGLGERMALLYIKKFIKSYQGIILSCYLLGAALSFIIPHPWPRSFLILSVMECVIQAANVKGKYADNIRLAVFVGSIPTSMLLLTGDSSLNSIVGSLANEVIPWGKWFVYMGVPAVFAIATTYLSQRVVFGSPEHFQMDKAAIASRLEEKKILTRNEKICMVVLSAAVACWISDSILGIHPAWVAMGAVIIFAMPKVEILTGHSLSSVNIGTLLFLCAALSIGNVGRITGMNAWIAQVILPDSAPANPYIFALVTCLICMAIHMMLGSTLAVLGIAVPAILSFAQMSGIPALNAAFITYIAVATHWLLPFHHMNILVGCGSDSSSLKEKQVLKMGLVQTGITILICLVTITWWNIAGLS